MQTTIWPTLEIKGKKISFPVIQGGMGVGVSLYPLAKAVAREGGIGIVSSACLDRILKYRNGRAYNIYDAIREEISLAKEAGGVTGINIMRALDRDFNDSVRGAIDAGADMIICGAGLPFDLPAIQDPKETALVPIVSSARALEIICKKWERLKPAYRPDAVVLEGPLAGGHLGFPDAKDIYLEENKLENLLPAVKDVAKKYGNFPVIVAGGIYTHKDILRFLELGADGVQMGTRFLATEESSANPAYKLEVVKCKQEDIIVVDPKYNRPGSPCELPFRIIRQSPMYLRRKLRKPKCNKGYVLRRDTEKKYSICPAKEDNEHVFCICNGLLSSGGAIPEENEPELWTVGANAHLIKEIVSVHELMEELKGNTILP